MHPNFRPTPTSKIPPLLLQYIEPLQSSSLYLISEVVTTSSAWLLQCCLSGIYSHPHTTVVLVSWVNSFEFWRRECRRINVWAHDIDRPIHADDDN
jgi:hypothetical protein